METNKNILEHIKVKTQTQMDASYFEQFNTEMLQKIKLQKKTKVFYLRPIFWTSSVAASLLVFFGLQFFQENSKPSISKVSDKEIETYLEENTKNSDDLIEIEVSSDKIVKDSSQTKKVSPEILEKIDNTELASMEGFVSSQEILEQISAEDIYNFMNEEELDIEEIENSLFK